MTITRKEFLKGAVGLALEATISPVGRAIAAALSAGLLARSAQATPTILVGADSSNAAVYGSGSPNIVVSSPFTAVASGTATSMSIDINYESGDPIKLSIWTADGLTKLGETGAFADSVGVQTVNLISSVAIVQGTIYLLAAISSGAYIWVNADGNGWLDYTTDSTYPSWPSSIPLYSNSGNGKIAIWANDGGTTTAFDYYISPSGSDSNDGSEAHPWAISALNTKRATYSGKKIGFLSGTYTITIINDDSDSPTFDIEGGTSSSPTVLCSVTPRGAVMNGFVNGKHGNGHRGVPFGNTQIGGRQYGNLVWDGFKFTGFAYHILEFGTYSDTRGYDTPGVVVRNCWFTGNSCLDNTQGTGDRAGQPVIDNIEAVTLNNTLGAIIRNNRFENNIGHDATDGDHLSAVISWFTKDSLFEYNTSINSGAIYGKEIGNQGVELRYNYLDQSGIQDSGGGFPDWSGWNTTGLTSTTKIHHNIIICTGSAISLSGTLDAFGGFTTPIEVYNNTIKMQAYSEAHQFYVECALRLFTRDAGHGHGKVYNNIFTGYQSVDNKMINFNAKSFSTFDYNLRPSSGDIWKLHVDDADTSSGDNAYDASQLSSLRTAITSAGGSGAAFEVHGVTANDPLFLNTGTEAVRFKLGASSPAINAGKSNGTTSGTTCDIGAWGNGAPSTIGSDF